MDKDLIAKLAHAAGLDRAWAEFPDDARNLFHQIARIRVFKHAVVVLEPSDVV